MKIVKWTMLVSGVLTFTMIYAAVAPQAALRSMFGVTFDGPAADVVVRNWGALIAAVGFALIYGAFHVPSRRLALLIGASTKAFFVSVLVADGFAQQAIVPIVVDGLEVVAFIAFLLRAQPASATFAAADASGRG